VSAFLEPTEFIDSDHPAVVAYVQEATAGARDDRERVAALFRRVRDGIRYDAANFPQDRAVYKASAITTATSAFCVPKAVLLVAGARAMGIPARLAFADVRNHLQTPRMREMMGTDLFLWHGYAELELDGVWRKASPAFNAELCERFGVAALDFDGTEDAILHPFSGDGSRYMEYVRERGSYADLPYDEFMDAVLTAYPSFRALPAA
jgi:transglutaminase-like putative cysteine protease